MKQTIGWAILCVSGLAFGQSTEEPAPPKAKPALKTNYSPAMTLKIGNASIAKVKAAIAEVARNPSATQYRRVRIVSKDGTLICGEVNMQNGFGGLTGFKRFFNYNVNDTAFTIDDGSPFFERSWDGSCRKNVD